jgi:hypothetical protein
VHFFDADGLSRKDRAEIDFFLANRRHTASVEHQMTEVFRNESHLPDKSAK